MRFAFTTGSRPLDGYTIKRGIGVGGFGEVYFALSDAGKEVAIKRIQRNMDVEVRGVTQCLNLKHPNLISLHDIRYDDEGQAWVVMEYLNGETLKDALDRNPNGLPEEDAIDWFRGIAAGVKYLHEHGIVHRDLKPGNIFIDEDLVKIGDYGLSKYISCSRRSGQTESVGTFHYMAPEIGKGVYGKEIDVYALGVILFELLTGRVPFDGESSQEIIMKHLTAEPDVTCLPPAFRPIVQRALFKDPDKRFSDVDEIVQLVESAFERPAVVATQSAPTHFIADDVPEKPPVMRPPVEDGEPMYIGDEDEGIYLGPLKESRPTRQAPQANQGRVQAVRASTASGTPEPIAHAVKQGWRRFSDWWQHANLSLPVKAILILGAVFVLILNAEILIPMGIVLGALYLVYFGLRSIIIALTEGRPAATPPANQPAAATPRYAARRRRNWRRELRVRLGEKHGGERATELTGSMLMAAIVAAVVGLVMVLSNMDHENVYTWTYYAWITMTSVASAWSILAISKLWESDEGDQFRRRFVMLIAGLLVGTVAFGSATFLSVDVSDQWRLDLPWELSGSMYANGNPALPVYLIFFAGLFVILRWWLQADPLRSTRLGLWATALCVFWSALLPFPQPWGVMIAATTAVAVQLSAPWVTERDRARFRRELSEYA